MEEWLLGAHCLAKSRSCHPSQNMAMTLSLHLAVG